MQSRRNPIPVRGSTFPTFPHSGPARHSARRVRMALLCVFARRAAVASLVGALIAVASAGERPALAGDAVDWWSLRPVERPQVPEMPAKNERRVGNPIDAFVAARLAQSGLSMSPEAGRLTLVRRASFDLIGLPPTPAEVDAFLADASPDAYERLIDRLLASPRYGERWGRHWLDVVRFAETDGYERNLPRPNAWPYRDYVIRAFNDDIPYPQFILHQLAGDQLGEDAATGFLVGGAHDVVIGQNIETQREQRALELDDMVSTNASAFLGLSVGCARCHDHKADPITQSDYYAMQAIFAGVRHGERAQLTPGHRQGPGEEMRLRRELAAINRRLAEIDLEPGSPASDAPAADVSKRPSGLTSDGNAAADLAVETKSLETRREQLLALLPSNDATKIYAGMFVQPPPTHRLHRGDPMQPRETVAPGGVAAAGRPLALAPNAPEHERRLALARWIGEEANPLTARVMVNRLWHYHFGRGLVATTSNFGFEGQEPSHPELLDWLAAEFIERGWRTKAMHRLIMLSATYRQSGAPNSQAQAIDADGRLLWRYTPRRLEAEPIRDAILAISGLLDLRAGGPGYDPFEPNNNFLHAYVPKQSFGPAEWRRMVYQLNPRVHQDSTFGEFDCPDASQATPQRNVSTTPRQALNLLNSPFMVEPVRAFAERVKREAGQDPAAQTRWAFRVALARLPDEEELTQLVRLVQAHGLEALCRTLYNTNEFIYVD
jgi:Protein of unknown function (DUF1553)/Protein of unknown function (DUF1549)